MPKYHFFEVYTCKKGESFSCNNESFIIKTEKRLTKKDYEEQLRTLNLLRKGWIVYSVSNDVDEEMAENAIII